MCPLSQSSRMLLREPCSYGELKLFGMNRQRDKVRVYSGVAVPDPDADSIKRRLSMATVTARPCRQLIM